jgi:putative flippase GtrA
MSREKFTPDIHQVFRFSLVGAMATAVHFTVILVAVSFFSWRMIVVHGLAYLCAFLVSFVGHYKFTFASATNWKLAFIRFLAVSFITLGISSLIAALGMAFDTPRLATLLVAAASVAIASYLLQENWVF